ncbi:MAG TPA: FAD-dependent oxidoreductase, partial [Anaeromyxobacter sp.]
MNAQAASGFERPRTIVVGAGVSGLVIARQLTARGVAVTLVDRNAEVGGLARTFRYDDGFFDTGPHLLRAEDAGVHGILRSALGDDVVAAPFQGGVHAFGRTHPLPIRGGMLRALPLRAMLHGAWDLVRRERVEEDSYESEVVSAYGRTLYEALFRRATERFLMTPAERIDADWARFGLLGADRQAEGAGLYPRRGIGALAAGLASDVLAAGGRILLGREVKGIDTAGNRVVSVRAGGERLAADAVVWTAPLTRALHLLGFAPGRLRFVSTVLYNLTLREPSLLRYPWVCYSGEERFVRVSDPTAFSPQAAPAGRGALCVECTCREGDPIWEDPSRHVATILVGLALTGAMRSVKSVEGVYPERLPDTYPVYERGYREELGRGMGELSRYGNLVLAGRNGLFWCNRTDQAIAHGLRVAARLDPGRPA